MQTIDPDCVKTLRGITAPEIFGSVVGHRSDQAHRTGVQAAVGGDPPIKLGLC